MDRATRRRAILAGTRRKIERTLVAADAVDELAVAAEVLLTASGDDPVEALRAALAKYRKVRGT